MVNLVIIFIVAIATVKSVPLQELDPDDILEILEKPQKQELKQRGERQNNGASSSLSSDDDSHYDDKSDDGDDHIYRALRNADIIDLIQKTNHDRGKDKFRNMKDRESLINGIPVYSKAHNRDDRLNKKIFRNQFRDRNPIKYQNPRQKIKKKRLDPNNLLSSYEPRADEHENTADLNNFSKIYIVLNPLAIQQSESENAVNNLILKVLSMVSSSNGRQSRRARRESNEMHSPRDSMEDYKPKRLRNDHGGGGGRTAIPYIRHRGDIFERDN